MHEEMMVGFRRRRTHSRSGWGTPRPSLVASDVVSSRLVVGPVAAAAIIGGALGLTADANAANPDMLNLNPRTPRTHQIPHGAHALVLDPPAATNHEASNAETDPRTGPRCQ
jgi:hypothetical protein